MNSSVSIYHLIINSLPDKYVACNKPLNGLNSETISSCTTTVNLPSYDPREDRIEGRF